ncbi:insulinoma-associated protein 1b-like [Myxocyprinus asiaticus]|uniref:insulinoma-associated protein 1b-like n=1 Tax=Myxocyprinus asiaticus TaxID=70543 RepID=UPI002223D06C|nr:insulinoma-associated protein 1b-like [Myxocyprinus asiaticus]
MPKGFLVKRNKKVALVSYRIRSDEDGGSAPECQIAQFDSSPPVPSASKPDSIISASRLDGTDALVPVHSAKPVQFGNPEAVYQALHSPTRPISKEHNMKYFERTFNIGSPVSAESFPTAASLTSLDHNLLFAPVDLKIGTSNSNRSGIVSGAHAPSIRTGTKRPSTSVTERKSRNNLAKKPKAIQKLSFEDEVTTSPVLGLKIKEGPVDSKPRPATSNTNKPLGEFICQLCKEEYSDPFSLAQHKCSRIVRVEYRCPECDKVFSCPANLASHRRWHKPRVQSAPKAPIQPAKLLAEDLKDMRTEFSSDRDSSSPGVSESGSDDGLYDCQNCGKRFKRQAYLRKHIMGHQALQNQIIGDTFHNGERVESPYIVPSEDSQSQSPLILSPVDCLLCPACGENLPNIASLERHLRILHDDSQAFPCKFCPATFYSSPGLSRHINKCHPTENRQVILLHMPVRNAC